MNSEKTTEPVSEEQETVETETATVQKPVKRQLFKDPVPWIFLALALAVDQITKAIVIANLSRGESWPEEGFIRATYVWNTGTAFSLFQGQGGPLTVFSFVAVIALYFVYRTLDSPTLWVRIAFGLLIGGAFGNLTDRIRLGHVTDFIDVGPWPIFNIADSSIVVGIAVLFFYFWVTSNKDKEEEKNKHEPMVSSGSQDQPSGG